MLNARLRFGLLITLSLILSGIIDYIANFIVEKEIKDGQKLLEDSKKKKKGGVKYWRL